MILVLVWSKRSAGNSAIRQAVVAAVDAETGEESKRWAVHWQTRVPYWCDCRHPDTREMDDDWPPVRLSDCGQRLEITPRDCAKCGLLVSPQIKLAPTERRLPTERIRL